MSKSQKQKIKVDYTDASDISIKWFNAIDKWHKVIKNYLNRIFFSFLIYQGDVSTKQSIFDASFMAYIQERFTKELFELASSNQNMRYILEFSYAMHVSLHNNENAPWNLNKNNTKIADIEWLLNSIAWSLNYLHSSIQNQMQDQLEGIDKLQYQRISFESVIKSGTLMTKSHMKYSSELSNTLQSTMKWLFATKSLQVADLTMRDLPTSKGFYAVYAPFDLSDIDSGLMQLTTIPVVFRNNSSVSDKFVIDTVYINDSRIENMIQKIRIPRLRIDKYSLEDTGSLEYIVEQIESMIGTMRNRIKYMIDKVPRNVFEALSVKLDSIKIPKCIHLLKCIKLEWLLLKQNVFEEEDASEVNRYAIDQANRLGCLMKFLFFIVFKYGIFSYDEPVSDIEYYSQDIEEFHEGFVQEKRIEARLGGINFNHNIFATMGTLKDEAKMIKLYNESEESKDMAEDIFERQTEEYKRAVQALEEAQDKMYKEIEQRKKDVAQEIKDEEEKKDKSAKLGKKSLKDKIEKAQKKAKSEVKKKYQKEISNLESETKRLQLETQRKQRQVEEHEETENTHADKPMFIIGWNYNQEVYEEMMDVVITSIMECIKGTDESVVVSLKDDIPTNVNKHLIGLLRETGLMATGKRDIAMEYNKEMTQLMYDMYPYKLSKTANIKMYASDVFYTLINPISKMLEEIEHGGEPNLLQGYSIRSMINSMLEEMELFYALCKLKDHLKGRKQIRMQREQVESLRPAFMQKSQPNEVVDAPLSVEEEQNSFNFAIFKAALVTSGWLLISRLMVFGNQSLEDLIPLLFQKDDKSNIINSLYQKLIGTYVMEFYRNNAFVDLRSFSDSNTFDTIKKSYTRFAYLPPPTTKPTGNLISVTNEEIAKKAGEEFIAELVSDKPVEIVSELKNLVAKLDIFDLGLPLNANDNNQVFRDVHTLIKDYTKQFREEVILQVPLYKGLFVTNQ
jgi:hypothetical protein